MLSNKKHYSHQKIKHFCSDKVKRNQFKVMQLLHQQALKDFTVQAEKVIWLKIVA